MKPRKLILSAVIIDEEAQKVIASTGLPSASSFVQTSVLLVLWLLEQSADLFSAGDLDIQACTLGMDDQSIFLTYSELSDERVRDAENWAQEQLKSLG